MYQSVLFDLDGTILYTLEDLTTSVNLALKEAGFPARTTAEVRASLGSGTDNLIRGCLPEGTPEDIRIQVTQRYRQFYDIHFDDVTAPYPGIPELIRELNRRGCKVAVLTNKMESVAQKLCQNHFPGQFIQVIGQKSGQALKPDPTPTLSLLQAIGASPAESCYIGDSEVDIRTGLNAGMATIACDWGYRDREYLLEQNPPMLVSTVEELAKELLK